MKPAPAPFASEGPRISCLMVTANRRRLAERSVDCFVAQTYPNRELVIVDDGEEDYAGLFASIPADRVNYHRLTKDPAKTLGDLRNMTLDLARGDYISQWDDDDWFDPARLSRQLAAIGDKAAAWAPAALMHLDEPAWIERPYIGYFQGGAPSTIIHRRRDDIRYPSERKGEDSTYRDAYGRLGAAMMGADDAALLIRCFHGGNTWDRTHFRKRLALRPWHRAEWAIRRATGTTADYALFRLSPRQRASFDAFLSHSRGLGLF